MIDIKNRVGKRISLKKDTFMKLNQLKDSFIKEDEVIDENIALGLIIDSLVEKNEIYSIFSDETLKSIQGIIALSKIIKSEDKTREKLEKSIRECFLECSSEF